MLELVNKTIDGEPLPISTTNATLIIGVVNFIFAFVAVIPLALVGRKKLLTFGELGMGLSMILAGVMMVLGSSVALYVFLLCLIVSFHLGIGSVVWVYTAEVTVDSAAGLCALA